MKWFKKTENLAIVIAIISLLMSGFTWLNDHNQTQLFEAQIRSYVQVVEVKLMKSIMDADFIELQLKLKNFGQTAAINVQAEMDYQLGSPDLKGHGNIATRQPLGSYGPGFENTIVLKSNRRNSRNWPVPRLSRYESVYFYGTIWYTDETTNKERKEDWCCELPLKTPEDLQRTNLESCGILKYSSNEQR